MIRLDNISKQNGHQILFIDASMGIQKGEKAGLVGPNGAGKTTLFRIISGEEEPDDGQVTIEAGMTIGYFSQDVGEMSGRDLLAEMGVAVRRLDGFAIVNRVTYNNTNNLPAAIEWEQAGEDGQGVG